MNELLKKGFDWLERYWHKKPAAVIAPILAALAAATVFYSPQIQNIPLLGWGVGACVGIMTLVIWFVNNRLPQVKKGNVGIVVGIACDNPEQDKQVRADFVQKLRELVQQGVGKFQLLELPVWSLSEIGDEQFVTNVLKRTRGHFILYGRVRKRNLNGREAHVLNFEGAVRHFPASLEVQRDLGADFATVLPRRLIIEVENDAFVFEATSEWTELSARYVIGMAAFISGDAVYAEQMFLYVDAKLKQHKTRVEGIEQVYRRLPERFDQLYNAWLTHLYNRYFVTRARAYLVMIDEVSSKLLNRNPRNQRALLTKAICEFSLRRTCPPPTNS